MCTIGLSTASTFEVALRLLSGIALFGAVAGTGFEEIVAIVKSQGASWKADVPTRFDDDVKQPFGTFMRGNETFNEMDYAKTNDQQWNGVVPDSFDVRTAWPQCPSVSGHIRAPPPVGGAVETACSAFGHAANAGAGKAPRGLVPRFDALE